MRGYLASDLVRSNKTSSATIAVTVCISSLLLAMLASVLFNFWADATARTAAEGAAGELQATAAIYLIALMLSCAALILIIRNTFAASMSSRVHQLGILATVGATPRQIRTLLIKESLVLSLIPAAIGIALGVAASFAFVSEAIRAAEAIGISRPADMRFRYSPLVLAMTALMVLMTVLASAGSPARKMAKIGPLDAVHALPEAQIARFARPGIIPRVFGVEGELASASMRQRRKALRSSSIALGLSFFVIVVFLSFMTISKMSVDQTYYEWYGIEWDMVVDIADISDEAIGSAAASISSRADNVMVGESDKGKRIYIEQASDAIGDQDAELILLLNESGITDYEIVDMADEKQRSEEIWSGYAFAVGGFCCILALIGIAGIFSQAIGFTYQRNREFARYRSLGMTPQGVYRMLGIEGLITVVRPLLIALPLAIAAAVCLALSGDQPLGSLAANFPYAAVLAFVFAALLLASVSYLLGAARILSSDLAETLKNDMLI